MKKIMKICQDFQDAKNVALNGWVLNPSKNVPTFLCITFFLVVLLFLASCTGSKEKEVPSIEKNKLAADSYVAALFPQPAPDVCADCDSFEYVIKKDKLSTYVAVDVRNGEIINTVISEGKSGKLG